MKVILLVEDFRLVTTRKIGFSYYFLALSRTKTALKTSKRHNQEVLGLQNGPSMTLCSPLQAALLSSFPAIFEELLPMFSVTEVAEFVRGTLSSLPSTLHLGQSMDVVKLQSIGRTVDCRLFSFP
ncbi:hypothetical protein AB205_0094250, partial [Aquarana catesbeiana]